LPISLKSYCRPRSSETSHYKRCRTPIESFGAIRPRGRFQTKTVQACEVPVSVLGPNTTLGDANFGKVTSALAGLIGLRVINPGYETDVLTVTPAVLAAGAFAFDRLTRSRALSEHATMKHHGTR
jgi:hypothetical protein